MEALYQYTQETTVHGVRYITIHGQTKLRRIVWICCFATAVTFFIYAISERLDYLLQRPKSVNVEIRQVTELPFPGVTICNQNQMRLSAVQKEGLTDTINKYFKNATLDDSRFLKKGKICTTVEELISAVKETPYITDAFKVYGETTIEVCAKMCEVSTSKEFCSMIVYFHNTRHCYAGPLIDFNELKQPKMCTHAHVFLRIRNELKRDIYCNFEGTDCHTMGLTGLRSQGAPWIRLFPVVINSPDKNDPVRLTDHTTGTEHGGMYSVGGPKAHTDAAISMFSLPFLDTTGKCLELYYSSTGSMMVVSYIREDLTYGTILTFKESIAEGRADGQWKRLFYKLPAGKNMILIASKREMEEHRLSIDDLRIKHCDTFLKSGCRRTLRGEDYMGQLSFTSDGEECMKWSDVNRNFPRHNYCTYLPINVSWYNDRNTGPWCVGKLSQDAKFCHIPFCDCEEGMFQCVTKRGTKGPCLPLTMLCDGKKDCPDDWQSEETSDYCGQKVSISCKFKEDYMCGYEVPGSYSGNSWLRKKDCGRGKGPCMFLNRINSIGGVREQIQSPKERVDIQREYNLTVYYDILPQDTTSVINLYISDSKVHYSGTKISSLEAQGNRKDILFKPIDYGFYHKSGFMNIYLIIEAEIASFKDDYFEILRVSLTTTGKPKDCDRGKYYCKSNFKCLQPEEICLRRENCPALYPIMQCKYKNISCSFNGNLTDCQFSFHSSNVNFNWVQDAPRNMAIGAPPPTSGAQCGNLVHRETRGSIWSPGFPGVYGSNLSCIYVIEPSPGSGPVDITLNLQLYDIYPSDHCTADYLKIYDGYTLLSTNCGLKHQETIYKATDKMTLEFRSDAMYSAKGFYSTFSMMEKRITSVGIGRGNIDKTMVARFTTYEPSREAAYMTSPLLVSPTPTCLQFRYAFTCACDLYVIRHYDSVFVIETYLQPQSSWKKENINIPNGTFHLTWAAKRKNQPSAGMEVRLDDVFISPEPCPNVVNSGNIEPNKFGTLNDVRGFNKTTWFQELKTQPAQELNMENHLQLLQNIRPSDYPRSQEDFFGFGKTMAVQPQHLLLSCRYAGTSCDKANVSISTTYSYSSTCVKLEKLDYNTTLSGTGSGFVLVINMENYDNMKLANSYGTTLTLFDPREGYTASHSGFKINPGASVTAVLSLSSYKYLVSGNNGSTSCRAQHGNKTYNQEKCQHLKWVEAVQKSCGCNVNLAKNCKEPKMPYCTTHQYLNCTKGVPALLKPECPLQCSFISFDQSLSYSSLSGTTLTSGINHHDHITDEVKRELEERLKTAIDLDHRINPRNFEVILNHISYLSESLENFVYVAESQASGVRTVIHNALVELLKVFQQDVTKAHELLTKLQDAYDKRYYAILDDMDFHISSITGQCLNYLAVKRAKSTLSPAIPLVFPGSTTASTTLTRQFIEFFQNAMKRTGDFFTGAGKTTDPYLPGAMINNMKDLDHCSKLFAEMQSFENVTAVCTSLVTTAAKAFRSCVRSYETALHNAAKVIEETNITIEKTLKEEAFFLLPKQYQYQDILTEIKLFQVDLQDIRNQFEKHDKRGPEIVSNMGYHYSTDIEANLQKVITLADDEHAKTMRYAIQRYMMGANNLYGKLIKAFADVALYVDTNKVTVEEQLRKLKVFLKPALSLQSAKLFKFEYTSSDRQWPKSVSLRALVEGRFPLYKEKLRSVMAELSNTIMEFFNDMYSGMQTSKVRAMSSLAVLGDVTTPYTKYKLDDDFVKSNLAIVDIYYGSMEREYVEQSQAYTIINFFSDVGGYLGLLVGASILSVCEMIDVCLNICVQNCNSKKRRLDIQEADSTSQDSIVSKINNN